MATASEAALDHGAAVAVLDFARENGIHNMPTPTDDEDRLQKLAGLIVKGARNAYRGGEGNTGQVVVGVLKLAGEIDDEKTGSVDGSSDEPAAKAEEVSGGGEDVSAGEEHDGEAEAEAEQPDAGDDAAGEESEGSEEEEGTGSAEKTPSHKLPLRAKPSAAYVKALERVLEMRLPTPQDLLDGEEPIKLPADITEANDVDVRRAYWERHSLFVYCRWMHARLSNALSDAEKEYEEKTRALYEKWRADDPSVKDVSDTELKQRARAHSSVKKLRDEVHELTIAAGEVRAHQDGFSSDVDALSREYTMRSKESHGPGPFSK